MFCVKEAEESHIPDIARLEREIFPDAWSRESLTETLRQPHARIFGAWQGGRLAGYLILYHVLDEGEIARIAVARRYRRQGAALALMGRLEGFCREEGIARILLDVRESNAGALAFYRKCGFVQDGVRRGFYTAPAEDAVLMSRTLGR